MMDDAKRKKLRFKKTETSRLKTGATAVPGEGDNEVVPDAVSQPETGEMTEAGLVGGAPEIAIAGETGITDPMAMRDTNTSKVRRISADKESSPLATAVVPGTTEHEKKTETVQLKVVQQKKKEIASMISPGSTVRLRMPGKSAGPERSDAEARKPIVPNDTLKLAGPPSPPDEQVAGEVPTEPTMAAEDKRTATQTLPKIGSKKPLLESAAAQTVAVSPPSDASVDEPEGEAGGTTLKTGGRTLKLRGGKSSRTVRIPSGSERDGGASTVRVPGDEMPEGASLDITAARVTTSTGRQEPGVGFTIAAFITLAAVAGLVIMLTLQYLTHIQ